MFVHLYKLYFPLTCPFEHLLFFFTSLTISFVIWTIAKQIKYYRFLPPGPWGLPILGCLPWMRHGAPHSWYLQLSARYGDLISLRLGSNLVVCIGSAKLLRDLFNRLDSTGRPHTPLNNLMEGSGIVLSEGTLWRRQRQFLFEKFRALGVKLWKEDRFEKFIMMEVEEFLSTLGKTNGEPIDPVVYLGRHVHNVICQLMMSFRFDSINEDFISFNTSVSRGMALYGAIHIGEYLPCYLNLPGKKAVLKEIQLNLENASKFHADHIKNRRQQRRAAGNIGHQEPVDLLDYYLDQIDKENEGGDESKIFPDIDPEKQMVQVMNDLFSAGMETSRTTLVWMLAMMVREPEVAAKVRAELAKVVAVGEQITLKHRSQLAYIEAVEFETLRRVSVVPLGTTHVNTSIWHINGYTIPAGTHIIPLINKINMDPVAFPEPEKFIPERFFRNGKLQTHESFMPFGVGRRLCLGEQLARMEIFLFFANLMNNFEFNLPESHTEISLDGVLGITHAPLPYRLSFKKLKDTV